MSNMFDDPAGFSRDSGGGEDWLQTYADAITLLMAFFVMMFSISKLDMAKFEMVRDSIQENIGHREEMTNWEQVGRRAEDTNPMPRALEGPIAKMEKVLQPLTVEGKVSVTQSPEGLVIDFPAAMLYPEGGIEMQEEAKKALGHVAWTLRMQEFRGATIVAEGHTDDTPTRSTRFPTNWEISAARSAAVVRFLEGQGIESERMQIEAFGETKPKVPNRDNSGIDLPENQAQNRRVVIRVEQP